MNRISTTEIRHIVCHYFKLKPRYLFSRNRRGDLVIPRQIYYYLCRKYTTHSYRYIGDNSLKDIIRKPYDHATVYFGDNKIKGLINIKDARILKFISEIEEIIVDCLKPETESKEKLSVKAEAKISMLERELKELRCNYILLKRNGVTGLEKDVLDTFKELTEERKKDILFKMRTSLKIQGMTHQTLRAS